MEQAGRATSEVEMSVKRVTDIVSDISSASREQSAYIDQVYQAINQIDHVTQQNTALVEEVPAATQSMAEQAQ